MWTWLHSVLAGFKRYKGLDPLRLHMTRGITGRTVTPLCHLELQWTEPVAKNLLLIGFVSQLMKDSDIPRLISELDELYPPILSGFTLVTNRIVLMSRRILAHLTNSSSANELITRGNAARYKGLLNCPNPF